MAGEAGLNKGTELILKATATTQVLTDGQIFECADDNRQPADNAGYILGIFELDLPSASPFSATPGAGSMLVVYERKINSDANDAPAVDANYKKDYIWTFEIDNDNAAAQRLTSLPVGINLDGGKYVVEWLPGTAAVTVDGDWELRLTPCSWGTAA